MVWWRESEIVLVMHDGWMDGIRSATLVNQGNGQYRKSICIATKWQADESQKGLLFAPPMCYLLSVIVRYYHTPSLALQ